MYFVITARVFKGSIYYGNINWKFETQIRCWKQQFSIGNIQGRLKISVCTIYYVGYKTMTEEIIVNEIDLGRTFLKRQ